MLIDKFHCCFFDIIQRFTVSIDTVLNLISLFGNDSVATISTILSVCTIRPCATTVSTYSTSSSTTSLSTFMNRIGSYEQTIFSLNIQRNDYVRLQFCFITSATTTKKKTCITSITTVTPISSMTTSANTSCSSIAFKIQ